MPTSTNAAAASGVTDPDELWRLQYVQSGGWGDAKTVATSALLSTFLARKEASRDLSANVKREVKTYSGVSQWVAERGFDIHPPRLAIRTPDWRWQLVRSYVLKRDCITGYTPKVRAADAAKDSDREALRARRAAMLQRRQNERGSGAHSHGPPQPKPLPPDATLEQQLHALVVYRAQLRNYLQDEQLAAELAHERAQQQQQHQQQQQQQSTAAARGSIDLGATIGSRTLELSMDSAGPPHAASLVFAHVGGAMTNTSTVATTSPSRLQQQQHDASSRPRTRHQHRPSNELLEAVRDAAREEVAEHIALKLGVADVDCAAVRARMLDDEVQRLVAAAEIRLLTAAIDRMNADSAIDREARVDVPADVKHARRQWYGQRVRDGAYVNESHRGAVSHLAQERHFREIETGVASPVRLRDLRPDTPGNPLVANPHGVAPESPAAQHSRRLITTPSPGGGHKAIAVPALVSSRGVLASSPKPTVASSPPPGHHGNAGRPASPAVDRIINKAEPVCTGVRGTRATRSQSAMGKLRRSAPTALSGIPPPARPVSRGGQNRTTAAAASGGSPQRGAGASETADERRTRIDTPLALWQRVADSGTGPAATSPATRSASATPTVAGGSMSPRAGSSAVTPTPLTQPPQPSLVVAVGPEIPVVDFACMKIRHVADLLRVAVPRKINNRPPKTAGLSSSANISPQKAGPPIGSPDRIADDDALSESGDGRRGSTGVINVKDPAMRVYDFGPTRNAAAAVHLKQHQQHQQQQQPSQRDRSPTTPLSDGLSRRGSALGVSTMAPAQRRAADVRGTIDAVPVGDRRFFMSDDGQVDFLEVFATAAGAPAHAGKPASTAAASRRTPQQTAVREALPCGCLLLHNNGMRSHRDVVSRPSASALSWSNQRTRESSFAGLTVCLSLLFGPTVWPRQLVAVDLSENRLTVAPEELTQLPSLRSLKLHGNQIADIDSVEVAALGPAAAKVAREQRRKETAGRAAVALPPRPAATALGRRLRHLTLHGNPLVDRLGKGAYTDRVRRLFPALTSLDGRRILDDERAEDGALRQCAVGASGYEQ